MIHTHTRAGIAIQDLINNAWGKRIDDPKTAKRENFEQIDHWLHNVDNWWNDGSRQEFLNYVWAHYPDYAPVIDDTVDEPDPRPDAADYEDEDDVVNHPSHYKTEGGLEAIDVLESFGLVRDGRLFNVGKYVLRAGKKDDELQDLKKAQWYLNRYIAELESNK